MGVHSAAAPRLKSGASPALAEGNDLLISLTLHSAVGPQTLNRTVSTQAMTSKIQKWRLNNL